MTSRFEPGLNDIIDQITADALESSRSMREIATRIHTLEDQLHDLYIASMELMLFLRRQDCNEPQLEALITEVENALVGATS